ncbi:hypothetical protein AJ80_08448 [Polytolypa hystricis UAMH7299]|uniref:Auxiliary Activity family 9 catalytic domain-containing protein n=1 Tax=Polytolypa hystricis (strain UAMH7299) TaxID=1447883 RepID=A0A2B7X7M2_POLH7|nr:hypothetical protein AJ80_08448 [Polytolypa hystricis UAMH7299]
MSILKPSLLLGALASLSLVDAHGYVTGIVADGQYHGGYLVDSYPYTNTPPDVVAWSSGATDLGFVDGSGYSSPDIICHRSSEPGALSAEVAAGGSIELQWTEWPESHHGPVIDYLANCNGDCSSVDKTQLKFFKISEAGLIDGSSPPGNWASDDLIRNNQSWTLTIPESVAPGNYVLRHEIIALHSAGDNNGAQNYPQCFNLKITGSGTQNPEGVLGTSLYTNTDPGIKIGIYQPLASYEIPGPALIGGGDSNPAPTAAPTEAPTEAPEAPTEAPIIEVPTEAPPAPTEPAVPSYSAVPFPPTETTTVVEQPPVVTKTMTTIVRPTDAQPTGTQPTATQPTNPQPTPPGTLPGDGCPKNNVGPVELDLDSMTTTELRDLAFNALQRLFTPRRQARRHSRQFGEA